MHRSRQIYLLTNWDVPGSTLVIVSNSPCIEAEKGHKAQLSFMSWNKGLENRTASSRLPEHYEQWRAWALHWSWPKEAQTLRLLLAEPLLACATFSSETAELAASATLIVYGPNRGHRVYIAAQTVLEEINMDHSFFSFFFFFANLSPWVALDTVNGFLNPLLFSRRGL